MWEEINITNVCDCKRATKPEHEDDYPLTGIIKDQTAKARSLGIKCVPLLDINRRRRLFFGKTGLIQFAETKERSSRSARELEFVRYISH